MRLLIGFLVMSFLSGCSTSPVTEITGKTLLEARIYEKSYIAPESVQLNKATVLFLRDSGFVGSACSHDIYVNDVKVFSIRQGEKIKLALDPGRYLFRLESGGACPSVAVSQSTKLESGDNEVYRILIPSDFSLRLTRMR